MTMAMRCELITWPEVQRLCLRLARQILESGYRPARVVAIARGGLIPARLLCDDLAIMALSTIRLEHYLGGAAKQSRAVIRDPLCTEIEDQEVLLVDDVNDSGDTLDIAIQHLQRFHPRRIRTAVMHQKATTRLAVDYSAKKIIKWRWLVYPWAVQEDLIGFIKRLSRTPASLQEARQLLAREFGLRIPQRRLAEVYAMMGRERDVVPGTAPVV
jgi:hypoxanthine phosphoribosyltransferase